MSATVTYKGSTLTTAENLTRTLKTAGKYLEGDLIITDITQGGDPKDRIIRPDAELIQTFTGDEKIVEDLGLTLPAYKTSAQTIHTGTALTPTITVDTNNYCYYVIMHGLAVPIYSTETKQKGRCEYGICTYMHELAHVPASAIKTIDGSKAYASQQRVVQAGGSAGRELYWSSASAIAVANNVTYGAYCTGQAPTISGTTLTVKAPIYGIRGNTSYMTSGAWGYMTDIHMQYEIQVWRAPSDTLDGWQLATNLNHIIKRMSANGGLFQATGGSND